VHRFRLKKYKKIKRTRVKINLITPAGMWLVNVIGVFKICDDYPNMQMQRQNID